MTQLLDPETALLTGCAQLLAAAGAGTWQPDGLYPDDAECVITLDLLPVKRQAIALRIVDDVPVDRSTTRYQLQALARVTPGAADGRRRVGLIRDAFHMRISPPMPPGIRVTSLNVRTRGPLGRHGAWDEHSVNFTALAARASAWAGGAAY